MTPIFPYIKRITRRCLVCKDNLKLNQKKYCSLECHGVAKAKILNEKKLSAFKPGKESIRWKNGSSRYYYIPASIKIHGNSCQKCGSRKNMVTHHIDGNRKNNPEDGSNWQRLCSRCHLMLHKNWERLPKFKEMGSAFRVPLDSGSMPTGTS